MKVRIEPYTVEHLLALGADSNQAIVNQITGPAYTLMTDEKHPHILGCCGIRITGVAQAWAMPDPVAMKEHPILLARKARIAIDECLQEEKIYRCYAEASEGVDAKFFNHFGFRNSDRLYVR